MFPLRAPPPLYIYRWWGVVASPPSPRVAQRGRSWIPSPIPFFFVHRWSLHLSQATWALRNLCAWPNKTRVSSLSPCWPLEHGGTLGGLLDSSGSFRNLLEAFSGTLESNFPYINLYLRNFPELLVISGISSGTLNNIW